MQNLIDCDYMWEEMWCMGQIILRVDALTELFRRHLNNI